MKIRIGILAILLCMLLTGYARSEEKNPADRRVNSFGGWMAFGFGKSYFGPTWSTSFSMAYKHNVITFRHTGAEEFHLGVDATNFDDPSISIKENGILYGRSFRNEILVFNISAGATAAKTSAIINMNQSVFPLMDLLSMPDSGSKCAPFSESGALGLGTSTDKKTFRAA